MNRSSFRHTRHVDKILHEIDLMLKVKKVKNVHVSRQDYKLLVEALELPLWKKRLQNHPLERFQKEIPYKGISIKAIGI